MEHQQVSVTEDSHKQLTSTYVQTRSMRHQLWPVAVVCWDEFSDVIQRFVQQQNSLVVQIGDENVSFSVDGEMMSSVKLSCVRPTWSTVAARETTGLVDDADAMKWVPAVRDDELTAELDGWCGWTRSSCRRISRTKVPLVVNSFSYRALQYATMTWKSGSGVTLSPSRSSLTFHWVFAPSSSKRCIAPPVQYAI